MPENRVKDPKDNDIEKKVLMDEDYPEIETFENIDSSSFKKSEEDEGQRVVEKKKGLFTRIKDALNGDVKNITRLEKKAEEVMALQGAIEKLSEAEIKGKTEQFKQRVANGEALDDILVEAYAVAREAARRVLGEHAFKVQIMGAIALHEGDIAEMKTGEGKTLTSILPAYLNGLSGKGVHIVTVNDYLAGVGRDNNGRVFNYLGLTVGLNKRELNHQQKREQYLADITYTTNSELGFDYLRDNMVKSMDQKVLRPLNYAIVDEVDSILVDEARTPLIISGGEKDNAKLYLQADSFVKSLADDCYDVDVETKSVTLNEHGVNRAEKHFKVSNLFDIQHTALVHHINQALKANFIMKRDIEYVVSYAGDVVKPENGEIVIVDQFTGRLMPGRAYSDGLHQAIEAKENVRIKQETVTLATITYQNFFRLYNKLSGMTGTAKTEEEEFRLIYNMRVVEIPVNKPIIRIDAPDLVFAKSSDKFKALCDDIEERNKRGQPVLVGTVAVETSEKISKMLAARKIRHNVLNAKNHEKEALIIEKAGVMGAVTIATNMAGRGTDIKLGGGVAELGGLAVLGSERHESRRIDNQLRGRSGRQGDPGYSRFYVSFEDELMVRFGGERIQSLSGRVLEGEPIESKIISKTIESAQKRVEGQNFDSRKQVLQFDDVMRQQREIMYKERDEIMSQESVTDIVYGMIKTAVSRLVDTHTSYDGKTYTVNMEEVAKYVTKNFLFYADLAIKGMDAVVNNPEYVKEKVAELVINQYEENYNERFKETPAENRHRFENNTLLSVIDYTWINHIDAMSKLRNGIYLRAYAQKDPLQEYTKDGFEMFEEMTLNIATEVANRITGYGINRFDPELQEKMGGRKTAQLEF